jgi:hypothetical protein
MSCKRHRTGKYPNFSKKKEKKKEKERKEMRKTKRGHKRKRIKPHELIMT